MNNLNETIETLKIQFGLLEQKDTRANKTLVRKTLQDLKNKCHALRKEILGKTKAVIVPIEPVAPPNTPVVAEVIPEPVESHPIPESEPSPVVKKDKKRKKTKKAS